MWPAPGIRPSSTALRVRRETGNGSGMASGAATAAGSAAAGSVTTGSSAATARPDSRSRVKTTRPRRLPGNVATVEDLEDLVVHALADALGFARRQLRHALAEQVAVEVEFL